MIGLLTERIEPGTMVDVVVHEPYPGGRTFGFRPVGAADRDLAPGPRTTPSAERLL
ncbi:hypothetical protein ACFPM0_27900 [Pseudonocardia sulfidoxydans]|uniref:hypothetical protein n=1 Tax=Pseudonocardia sulfidoxydans TaxID=54011 RepID=UPI003616C671